MLSLKICYFGKSIKYDKVSFGVLPDDFLTWYFEVGFLQWSIWKTFFQVSVVLTISKVTMICNAIQTT